MKSNSAIQLKAVRHVGINVKDIEISKKFYEEYFGFQVVSDCEDDSDYINNLSLLVEETLRMIKMKSDILNLTIELVQYRHNKQTSETKIYSEGIGHLAIQVEDSEKAWHILNDAGCCVLTRPMLSSDGYAKVFFCYDPNGFRLEIVELQK